MAHTNVVKKVCFFIYDLLDDELKDCLAVCGEFFDDIKTDFDFILSQIDIYQATVAGTLEDFERVYNCIPESGDTVAVRQNRVIAALRAKGGLNVLYFEKIAEGLGYTVGPIGSPHLQFSEGDYEPFRADYGQADIDTIYDQDTGYSMYTVVVTGTDVETDADLQARFEKQRCAGVEFVYVNE